VTGTATTISARFAAAADTYDHQPGIQRHVAGEVLRLLDSVHAAPPVLEIGCGTGTMTAMLRARFPTADLHAVDIAPSMVSRARESLGENSGVSWHVNDARHFESVLRFRLITSSSALHWLDPLPATFEHLATLLRGGGHMVFGMMVHGTLSELRHARRAVAPGKTDDDRLPTAAAVLAGLAEAGMTVREHRTESVQKEYACAKEFLRAIHAQGVTGGFYRGEKMLNRTELAGLLDLYDREYGTDVGVIATYRVLYVTAELK